MQLEPKIGMPYADDSIFAEAWQAINKWDLIDGINLLEALKQSHPERMTDILRLQAEVYFTRDDHETAWMLLDQILAIDAHDAQALILTASLASLLNDRTARNERLVQLKVKNSALAELLIHYLNCIEATRERTDLELELADSVKIDALLVYGYGLTEDGDIPLLLEMRLKKTLELARQFSDAMIIVSGGSVATPHNESRAMRNYLINNGVAANRITVEPLAKDTVGKSLLMAEILCQENELALEVVVITNLGHLARAWLSMKAILEHKLDSGQRMEVFAASYEPPNAYPVPESELALSYTTTLRALGIFNGRLGRLELF